MLVALKEEKPANLVALNRRIKSDLESFKTVMQENGYFGASFTHNLEPEKSGQKVTIKIDKGALYKIDAFDVEWLNQDKPEIKALALLEIPLGKTALPDILLNTEQQIFNALMQNGYYAPVSKAKELRVQHETQTVAVYLSIAAGPKAVFGETDITGLTTLDGAFVRRRIAWEQGAVFDIEEIAKTRNKLNRSGVISGVDIKYGALTNDGALPVSLDINESKHKSIGAGIAYSTAQEVVGNMFWEHRNLLGGAERFRVKLEGGTKSYGLSANLNKPDLWGDEDLSWQNALLFKGEELEAFNKETASYSTLLNYKYSATSAFSGGLTFEQSLIEEKGEADEDFTMISAPLTFRYDETDNVLDPREGVRLNASVTPYHVLNKQNSFVVSTTEASHYLPLGENFVWANRARAAFINGQSLQDIPADKRLYAGGGGSVRGYGHQLVGPLDNENDPTGGRMALEVGTEGRVKITDEIELVGFIEGGRVSEDIEFSGNDDFLWGVGSGVRYHTPIGPLRFDLAVPLEKRDADDEFQFYISIGQAF